MSAGRRTTAARTAAGRPRMSVTELRDALAEMGELRDVDRAAAADRLLEAARRTLLWQRGQALTAAQDAGSSEPELARALGMPTDTVRGLLAEHRRTVAAEQRAAAGQRPVNRSRVAQQLAQRLTAEAGVRVEIRWDSSSASSRRPGKWAYHVDWSNGPTKTAMRELVERLLAEVAGDPPGLEAAELVYLRTLQSEAVALAMIRSVHAGQPALGEHRHADALVWALDEVDHPERGTERERELAGRLGRLSDWNIDRMAELLDAHGLAALTGDLAPDPAGTVVPLGRPAGEGR